MSEGRTDPRGAVLLRLARETLQERLLGSGAGAAEPDSAPPPPWLLDQGATFVTLHQGVALRGCVGSLEPMRPLIDDVRRNALAAALEDSRFPPVEPFELTGLTIEVTLLARRERLVCGSERDAIELLRPGIDGLLLTYQRRRATFLPQVWDGFSSPAQFLTALKEKAGLRRGFWDRSIVLERYTAQSWSECAPGDAELTNELAKLK
jgi:hypothetical protein